MRFPHRGLLRSRPAGGTYSDGTSLKAIRLRESSRTHRRGYLAVLLQPGYLIALGALLDFPKELHRLGFVAWFARVVFRDDQLNLDGDDVPIGLNQPCPFDSLTRNSHD